MNIKRLVGTLALSLAAFAATPRAQAAGNISAIYPVDKDSLLNLDSPVSSVDEPLVAGDVVCFAVQLSPDNSDDTWRMHYIGTGSEAVESLTQPFALGIYVSGQLRYARHFDTFVEDHTTTLYFKYEVEPGDIALPVVLAVGQSSPQPANGTKLRDLEYHVLKSSTSRWVIDNSTADGQAATAKAVLSFMDAQTVYDADYDLRGAGFYVKTVGFDDDQEEDAWRSVAAGTKASGVIHVDPTPTNSVTLYVWSMDDSIVKVDGSSKLINFVSSTKESRSVATIKLKANVQDYAFTFTGDADAAGKETELVLSATPNFSYYNGTSARNADYQTAKVKVTTPPDPYMTLTDADGNQQISIEANTNSITTAGAKEMRLKFSKAFTKDVAVKIKQQINGTDVPAEEDYLANRYFTILLTQDNDPTTAVWTDTVTMKAGATEARFYIFPLGTTANLKSPGVTLVPDVSADPDATEFFAKGTANQKNALLKVTDQLPEVSVVAPSSGYVNDKVSVSVTVSDNWRDLQDLNTNGYHVLIRIGGQSVYENTGISFREGDAKSFDVSLPLEGHPLKGTVQVWDATHGNTYGTAEFSIDVDPARSATPAFYPNSDTSSAAYEDGHFFAEGETPYFRVNLTSDAAMDMYAFLVPANEAASNCVQCAAYSNGLFIASTTRSSGTSTIKFLDGYAASNPMRAMFKVDLRSKPDYDDPESVSYSSSYSFRSVELVCTNVSPTIVNKSMEVNNTTVENGGTLSTRVPAGALVTYRARLSDPSSIDLKATGDKAIISRWQYTDGHSGSKSTSTIIVTNSNGYVSCPISFSTANTTQTITVYARDKDDLSVNDTGVIDWGEPLYEFAVNVSDTPHVVISRDTAGEQQEFAFDENVDRRNAYVYVQLSEMPTGHDATSAEISASNPLVVELTVEQYASDGMIRLATNRVEFTNSGTAYKKVDLDLDSLNGQFDSIFIVRGAVVTDSHNAFGQPWSEYYERGESYVTVNNVDPEITSTKRTNGGAFNADSTNTCIAGESIAIHWKTSDVLPDVTNGNFTITWSVDPTADSPTRATTVITNGWPTTTQGRKSYVEGDFVFAAPTSSGTVTMTVEDGDGGKAEVNWYINIVKTLSLYVNVYGPSTSSQSKYNAAKGVGQGVVAVNGATKQTTTGFQQNWIFGEDVKSADVYAWGYPSKATWDRYVVENEVQPQADYLGVYLDKGQFPAVVSMPTLMSVALTPKGMSWAKGAYYDWSTMGGSDSTAGDYDNFFYRWFTVVSADDSQSTDADANDVASIVPTLNPLDSTRKTVSLDTGESQSTGASRAPVQIEAIFSREKFPKDNLGDINADYVPDRYVQLYGIGSDSVGTMPEDDLKNLETYNGDKDADGNDAPDYFPNFGGAAYSTLIPGIPSTWSSGQPFTARYEIRGYGDGLNNAPILAGIKSYTLDEYYTNTVADLELRKAARDYTELEMLAWSLTGYDVDWTPECPTDPTLSDTDGDGFTDGYEYYFWYRAHVGDPDYFKSTGKIRRITGRRFDPRNPGVGTVITSEEIEELMNPRVAYTGDAKTLDTDNDGLPDLLEYELGTNPFDFDTDGDGLPDGWEIMIAGLDPLTTNTYTDGESDTERNSDGDAMAIGSYAMEQNVKPAPLETEHAKRWTFAVIDENGDSDGVQWYAMASQPADPVVGETYESGWRLTATVDSKEYAFFSAGTDDHAEPVVYTDDKDVTRLGETLKVRQIEKITEPGTTNVIEVLGYPYTLAFGTIVKVEAVTTKISSYKIEKEIGSSDANACWIYGKGSANAELGEVAGSATSYGCLALARQKKVPAGAEIVAFPSADRDVAFLHYLCYQEFGFDPRTAWSPTSPVTTRWADSDEIIEGKGSDVGHAARTRPYSNYDEFLVYSFFLCNLTDSGETLEYDTTGKKFDSDATEWARRWYALTTNPQGPNDAELTYTPIGGSDSSATDDSGNEKHYYGRGAENGADTDGDGVPDGWELYVMSGPKAGGAYVFAEPYGSFTTGVQSGLGYATMPESHLSPFVADAKSSYTCNDEYMGECGGLNEFENYEGLDSIAVYTNVSTTIAHEAGWKWFNKFFPTDPWTADTDGDGIADDGERDVFSYGTTETTLVDDGKKQLFPGGGLNPCSVDTDKDGLPDPWEQQFAGTADSIVEGEEASGFRDGMDGTVSDAVTMPGGINRDYDHDGLENWQEYLTGMMRGWRYDDPISPLTYISSDLYCDTDEELGLSVFNEQTAAAKMKAAGYLAEADVNEFWYKTLVDATSPIYNPGLVTDMASGAQYFTRVTNAWDQVYVAPANGGAYYWFYDRVNGTKLAESWKGAWTTLLKSMGYSDAVIEKVAIVPTKYACCSPIDPDSDHDGMDDYYELFHGMNPLLGQSGVAPKWSGNVISSTDPVDLVYDSLGGLGSASDTGFVPQAWGEGKTNRSFMNYWQMKADHEGKALRGTGYDFVEFPWINGSTGADPDGDGIRNQEESIMPLVNPTVAWHHTDPTPLWMTDVSYSNSLVNMFYCLPTRGNEYQPSSSTFTYNGKTYRFKDFGGFKEGDSGMVAGEFNPDAANFWKLVGSPSRRNYIASFEQNEGYDSDHDGLMDQDELGGKYNGKTDPLDADSPKRRQAMYFQGSSRPSILQTMPFVRERHPLVERGGNYPDDMSFLQFTVECWVKAESLDDATIIERMIEVDRSSPDDREYMRRNFSIGIKGGKWVAAFDPNDTTKASVEVVSVAKATTEWTHIAVTYDMKTFKIFVNGKVSNKVTSSLQPTYGSSAVCVTPGSTGAPSGRTSMAYWADLEYDNYAIVVGAGFKTYADGVEDGSALDVTNGMGWDSYKDFFTGYVDEIRIWDGARSESEVSENYATRFTSTEAETNRDAFYEEWSAASGNDVYRGRYSKDGSGNAYGLPAELRFHWAFDSIFGGASEGAVAKAPAGFNYLGENLAGDGGRALRSRPEGYAIPWWSLILSGYTDTVYNDPAWVCWVPNTVAHLPRYDGTTLDSFYWSEDFKGATNGTYKFTRTAEPVSLWRQFYYGSSVDGGYFTTGTRYGLVTDDAYTNTSFTTVFEFTGRHLNQTGDDMLALGGAYARHVDEMWDGQGPSANWEVAGTDQNGNGLPDWWEDLAEDLYRDDAVTGDGAIDWNTLVRWPDQDGMVITAGEAYLRDLARGYHGSSSGAAIIDDRDGDFVQRVDEDGNGIPDWWEKIYGIEGESALDDHDNDGLPNYVEYLLSEVFKFKGVVFDPSRADSVQEGIPDYFYRVGSLYVGEIFTDHDLVDDSWEDLYDTSFASRLAYDAFADKDEDGWSNRSECRYDQQCRPIVASYGAHATESEGIVRDHPIPTMNVKLRYNGARRKAVEHADLGVFVRSEELANKVSTWADPDAFYWVQGGTTDNTLDMDTADAGTGNGESITRTFGKWSDRHVVGTMEPGNLVQTSIKLKYSKDPYAMTYSWYADPDYTFDGTNDTDRAAYYVHVEHCGYAHHREGTVEELRKDRAKYGAAHVFVEQKSSSYTELTNFESVYDEDTRTLTWTVTANKKILARINVATGAYDIDLGALRECSITSANGISTSLEDLCYRLDWMGNAAMSFPRRLYLGSATSGFVREGKNTVMVYADVNSNQTYDVGEPLGVARGVNVSWRMSDLAEIELLETNPLFARYNLVSGTTDREAVWVAGSTDVLDTGSEKITTDSDQRVRVVRYAVDNAVVKDGTLPTDYMAVVFDRTLRTVGSGKIWLTEDDILSSVANEFDLDWNAKAYDSTRMNLDEVATKIQGLKSASGLTFQTTNVYYAVVVGNGDIAPHTPTNFLSKMIVRCFDVTRQLPTLFAPTGTVRGTGSANDSVVYDAAPTFQWTMNGNNTYTAFKLQVLKDSTVIYDSGYQRMPPVDDKGRCSWTAPVFAGDKTTTGAVVDNGRSYSWRLSVYNAKFRSDSFVSSEPYYLNVQTNHPLYAVQPVAVRYFGPKESYAGKPIHVQAFESPDFIGMPVASAYVPAPDDPESGVSVTESVAKANATLIGLPKGTYYLRAYIDSNNNGVCDSWETMGYLCTRDGTVSNSLDPVALEYATQCGKGDVVQIFMEDADTDQDGLPDAWEYATYGSLTKKGIELLSETPTGQILVNKSLSGALELKEDASIPTLSLAGQALSTIRSAGTVALALGLSEPTTGTFADNISSAISPELTEDGVSISSLTIDADGNISLTVDVKAEDASVSSVFTSVVTVPKTIDVTCTVYHTASLAEEWKAFPSQTLTISVGTQTETLSLPTKADASSGFYKVEITK